MEIQFCLFKDSTRSLQPPTLSTRSGFIVPQPTLNLSVQHAKQSRGTGGKERLQKDWFKGKATKQQKGKTKTNSCFSASHICSGWMWWDNILSLQPGTAQTHDHCCCGIQCACINSCDSASTNGNLNMWYHCDLPLSINIESLRKHTHFTLRQETQWRTGYRTHWEALEMTYIKHQRSKPGLRPKTAHSPSVCVQLKAIVYFRSAM